LSGFGVGASYESVWYILGYLASKSIRPAGGHIVVEGDGGRKNPAGCNVNNN